MPPSQQTAKNAEMIAQLKALKGKKALESRLNGVLPMIDIAGQLFTVDVRVNQLRPKGVHSSNGLNLKHGGWYDDKTHQHCFYYDTTTRSEATINPDLTRLPKEVVMIRIPDAYALDPVAMAKKDNVDPEIYVKMFPLKMFHRAEVIPLQDTVIMDVADQNRRNQRHVKLLIKQKPGPKKKNKHRL